MVGTLHLSTEATDVTGVPSLAGRGPVTQETLFPLLGRGAPCLQMVESYFHQVKVETQGCYGLTQKFIWLSHVCRMPTGPNHGCVGLWCSAWCTTKSGDSVPRTRFLSYLVKHLQ